jgi:spermidine synthase
MPVLLLLFFGSGCAALIYQVVWLQLLQLVIGSSAMSLGVLLGSFMGGMCLGSLAFARVISPRRHPLRVYALIEVGIGVFGVILLFGMPLINRLYVSYVGHGWASILLRGVVCALCLLPPTILMGATLPAVARWVQATPQGVSQLGFLYGINIAGAVFGCLLAGFYLLRVHDMATATYVAVAVNLLVAGVGLVLAARTTDRPSQALLTRAEARPAPGAGRVYWVIGLSGMCALGAEVVWTRVLSLLLGGTVYTFSIILAVFLTGLGIGSSIGALIARHSRRPRMALGACQLLLLGAIVWTAHILAESLPYWPVDPSLSKGPWFDFQLDLVRCIWAVLPGAILWGASFPLALASVVAPGQDPGRLVGGVYAANTVGAIVGSLAFSMILVPWIGTRGSQQVMVGVSALSVLLLLVPSRRTLGGELLGPRPVARGPRWVAAAVVPILAALSIWGVPMIPWGLIAHGRHMVTYVEYMVPGITEPEKLSRGGDPYKVFCTYAREGRNVSIAVTESSTGVRSFHGAGKVQASNDPQDMRLQRMLGHLVALAHGDPESVLVVACGAGVTAGSFVPYPSVKRIVICDIEPLVPQYVAPLFGKENYNVVSDPRTQLVYDDGRHYVSTTHEKFDVITSDPIDPWVKGCAALNTVEYYEMCKARLKPGGIMALWMPLYESSPDTAKSLIATFFEVFPNGILWSNDIEGEGYDAVLFGQVEPIVIDVDELQQRLDDDRYVEVAQSLRDVRFYSATDLLATYAGQASRLGDWMGGAQINTDRNLRLQYLAGMWLNSDRGTEILNGILEHYTFPDEVFVGSQDGVQSLRQTLDRTRHVGVKRAGN